MTAATDFHMLVGSCLLASVIGCGSSPSSALHPSSTATTPVPAPRVITGPDLRSNAVPRPEPVNPRATKFKELDTNHDNKLTLTEFSAGRTAKSGEKWFKRRDADRDGFISLPEFLPLSAPDVTDNQDSQSRRNAARPPGESPESEAPSVTRPR
jgi:hypothetical protein